MAQFQMFISEESIAGKSVKIVQVIGSADGSNVEEVNAKIMETIGSFEGSLILSGSDLEYINSTFIGYMTAWYSTLTGRGDQLILSNLRSTVADTLEVVGLLGMIPNFLTVDEAKFSIGSQEQSSPVGV